MGAHDARPSQYTTMAHHDPIPQYVQDRFTHRHEGFPKLDYRTSLRAGKGPSGALLFSLVGVGMVVGFGLAAHGYKKKAYVYVFLK